MASQKSTAHWAGLIYLIVVISGVVSLMYVPSELYDWNDAPQTVQNIKTSKLLFKIGAVSGLICYVDFIFLPLVLFKLLQSVDRTHGVLMVVLAITSVPISLVAVSNLFSVLDVLGDSGHYVALSGNYRQAMVMSSLDAYYNGIHVSQVFWGLWLFPFGYLVYKSGFLPKVLGVFLMIGCFGYIIAFLGGTFFPGYHDTWFATLVGIPDSIGEIGICLWLLIKGVKDGPKTEKNETT
ncbi:MAG: DUF4386 domain-containing protein [Flavobacteriaceae bacterium]